MLTDAPVSTLLQSSSGIEYRTLDYAPGIYFDCRPLRATIRPETCAENWTTSQSPDNCRQQTCRGCQIGAAHAGRPPSTPAAASDEGWRCVHCGPSPTRRLVGDVFCISCYNRRRELISWRNGKNRPPKDVAEVLRPGWSVVTRDPDIQVAPTFIKNLTGNLEIRRTVRSKPFNNETSMLQPAPSVFLIGDDRRRLLWAIVETQTELERIARRLLPEYRIDNATLEPSFAEFRLCHIDPSLWMRICAPS